MLAVTLLLIASSHADPPAAKIDGVAGVSFGSTVDQVKAAMAFREAKFLDKASTATELQFKDGSFNNEDVSWWHFYFMDGKMYKATILIYPSDHQQLAAYERTKKLISDKYGEPSQATKIEMAPDQLMEMVRSNKLVLETDWHEQPRAATRFPAS
jgi:hypothetical protein